MSTKKVLAGAALIAAGVYLRRRSEDSISDDIATGVNPNAIAYSGTEVFPVLSGYHPGGALWVLWAREGGDFINAKIKIRTPGGKWLKWKFLREGSGTDGIPYMPAFTQKSPKARYPNTTDRRSALEDIKAALNAIGAVPIEWDESGVMTKAEGLADISIPLVANGPASFGFDDPSPAQPLMVNEIEASIAGLEDPR